MKRIIIIAMMVLMIMPVIALAQQTERGAITTVKQWFPSPLTLVTGAATMEYEITTQNTGLLPFNGEVLISLSGKVACGDVPTAIPGSSLYYWHIDYIDPDWSMSKDLYGGQGASYFEIEVPYKLYNPGESKTASLTITAPTTVATGLELTLLTSFVDVGTMKEISFSCDQIETTTAQGQITLTFIQLILSLGGLATILIPSGLAFI